MTSTLHDRPLSALAADLTAGRLSAEELVSSSLAAIDSHRELNAFITIDAERALSAARSADRLRARDAQLPSLHGIPIAHKDIFCTAGLTTTCGSRMLAGFVPPYESTVTGRIADHGAITVGKTNMDEFAMGSSNENSHFGPVHNPWQLDRVPGGSSGGSAAAVAAGLVPVATGSDTGGSIRQPAAFCGVTGLKPTYGRVSRHGMIAFASSLDQAGVFARSAEDCGRVLAAMAGADPLDATCADEPVSAYLDALTGTSASGLTIGLPVQYWAAADDAVTRRLEEACRELEAAGARLVEVQLQPGELAVATYYVVASAEASSNLSRYDGVRYGHRCEHPRDLADLYARSRAEGFGAEVTRRILTGTYTLSAGYCDAYYGTASKVRRLISNDFAAAFAQVDLLAAPTTPTTAFGLGEKVDDPIAMYRSDLLTVGASLAGLPALSLPAGLVDGLPVGLQLIGPHFSEALLLGAAHGFQQRTDHHLARPPA